MARDAMTKLYLRLMQPFASAHALAICELLLRDLPGWTFGRNRVVHEAAKISLWTASGLRGLRMEPIFLDDVAPGEPPRVLDAGTPARLTWVDCRLIWRVLDQSHLLDKNVNSIVRRVRAVLERSGDEQG
jgi:hypothetical protein